MCPAGGDECAEGLQDAQGSQTGEQHFPESSESETTLAPCETRAERARTNIKKSETATYYTHASK